MHKPTTILYQQIIQKTPSFCSWAPCLLSVMTACSSITSNGQIIKSIPANTDLSSPNEILMDLSDIEPGIYYLFTETEEEEYLRKY